MKNTEHGTILGYDTVLGLDMITGTLITWFRSGQFLTDLKTVPDIWIILSRSENVLQVFEICLSNIERNFSVFNSCVDIFKQLNIKREDSRLLRSSRMACWLQGSLSTLCNKKTTFQGKYLYNYISIGWFANIMLLYFQWTIRQGVSYL